jgi:hypothetical protein
MVFIKLHKISPHLALGVLSLHAFGLLFCGDMDCLYGEGDEICQTILCSLLDSHDHALPSPDHSEDDPCHCVCYLSYDIPKISQISISIVSSLIVGESHPYISILSDRIDHIPRA